MTANTNPKPFNICDDLVVKNAKRNVVDSGEQLSLQTTLEGGRHDDVSDQSRITISGVACPAL